MSRVFNFGAGPEAEADLREFMDIPPNYKVLFLQGGAQAQFAMVALNILGSRDQADHVDTGHWSKRAVTEASRFCTVNIAASAEASNFTSISAQDKWHISSDAATLHYIPNEIIGAVEFHGVPQASDYCVCR